METTNQVQSSMDERVSSEPWMYLLAAAVLMEACEQESMFLSYRVLLEAHHELPRSRARRAPSENAPKLPVGGSDKLSPRHRHS
eukprot:s2197_g4.t1